MQYWDTRFAEISMRKDSQRFQIVQAVADAVDAAGSPMLDGAFP